MIRRLALGVAGACACVCVGCSTLPRAPAGASPCAADPGGYACQIERYQRAPG